VKDQHEMSGLILTASCYPQIVTLSDDAGYQTGINDVVSLTIMIWKTEMLAAGCKGPGPTDTWLKYCGTAGFLISFEWLAREHGDTLKGIKR